VLPRMLREVLETRVAVKDFMKVEMRLMCLKIEAQRGYG
jgi:hypothetical protein